MTESNANPEPTTTPPAAPAAPPDGGGDLAALQAQIDAAAKTGGTQATAELAKTLGFDTADALTKFVAAQRKAIEDGKTEEQKRADELAAEKAAAVDARAEARELVRTAAAERALMHAGVAPENLSDAVRLLDLPEGELAADAVTAAVDALKAKPIGSALFGTKTGGTSGVTDQPAGEKGGTTVDAEAESFKAGVERSKKLRAVADENADPFARLRSA